MKRSFLIQSFLLAWIGSGAVAIFSRACQSQDSEKQSGESPVVDELEVNIELLIEQLESPKFKVRQRATQQLWRYGAKAEKKLRKALSSSNAEVVARVRSILDDFDYGIYPDTPAAIKSNILAFRDGSEQQKLDSGTKLLKSGRLETLVKLILKETDRAKIQFVIDDLFGDSDFVDTMLRSKNQNQALSALRLLNQHAFEFKLGASRQEQLRSEYLWLASVLNKIADESSLIAESLDENSNLSNQFLYVRCLRAGNDPSQSQTATDLFENENFAKKINRLLLLEQHQWSQLSDSYWIENRESISELEVPDLLTGLTSHRLAGEKKRFDHDLKLLYEFSDELVDDLALDETSELFDKVNNTTIFMICEYLFANHETSKALEYLSKTDKIKAFTAFVSIDDHKRAFQAIGIEEITPATAAIFERQIRTYKPSRWADSTADIESLADIVYAFYQLGFYKESISMYRTLYSIAARYETTQTGALEAVCRSMLTNDQKELFFELIRPQVLQNRYEFAVRSLFQSLEGDVDGVSLAQYWMTVFETEYDELKPIERLKLLDSLLRPVPQGHQPDSKMRDHVVKVEKELESEIDSWGDEAFLGFTYLLWNDRANAKKWFEKYEHTSPGRNNVALVLGDLYREDKQFDKAYDTYIKSWNSPEKSILALYLAGVSKRLAGDDKEAKRLIELANSLMLRSVDNQSVAAGLVQRELNQDAKKILNTGMKVSDFQSWEVGTARFRFINVLEEKDSVLAANLLENQLVDVGATNRYYPSMSSYTYYPVEAMLRRFNQALTENDAPKAFAAAKVALSIRPCSATIAEDYLPRLRKIQEGEDLANELFESIRAAHKEQLKHFPNSGLYNNNLAWINTTNKRHLDEALAHAEKVVKNEPNNATYLDTLADVCFNLGQVDRAIKLMEKCLILNPKSEHYNKQIKRFRQRKNAN